MERRRREDRRGERGKGKRGEEGMLQIFADNICIYIYYPHIYS
jgi:hypothetical protein